MFPARAEYRLTLRAENADQRLTGKGIALGCVGAGRQRQFDVKRAALRSAKTLANALSVTPNEAERYGILLNLDGQRRTAFELLSYPNLGMAELTRIWPQLGTLEGKVAAPMRIATEVAVS